MRARTVGSVFLVWGLGCPGAGSGPGGSSAPPRKIEPDEVAVTIRNHCPEAVSLHFGPAEPTVEAKVHAISAGGVEDRRIGRRDRVWLRVAGEWTRQRSVRASEDGSVIEVLRSCDGVTSRKGPL